MEQQLISKTQYKNFEPGEFIKSKKRTYEETIQLIEQFPWTKQREQIIIDLTNPSVTIEGTNNDFLKLAVFFNGKYVLHYLDDKHILYTKSFAELKDSYPFIKNYYENKLDITVFKKENTWMQGNLAKNFTSLDFIYTITSKIAKSFLFSTSWMSFLLTFAFIVMFVILGFERVNWLGIIAIFFIIFLIGGGLNLILFLNYYGYTKNKVLIMSKGNDTFYYGDKDLPTKYDKKDIECVTTIKTNGKSVVGDFAIIKIDFKDGSCIKIPNIFVDYLQLNNKLFEYPRTEINKFPYLRT